MEPKFQSSFIPKGPIAPTGAGVPMGRKVRERSLLAFLSSVIFTLSILLALGIFGYKFYLRYRINQMGADLESARAALQPETIRELVRLDNRIISTGDLISKHPSLTPLFELLEVSTPISVRFNDFRFSTTEQGLALHMRGEARGYAALALQADIFSQNRYFKNPVFSNLNLNERGDVNFSFEAIVDPDLVSYSRAIERIDAPSATTTATTTPK